MFCDCLNDPIEKHPNLNICPICAGHPGTLPVINKEAVEAVLKVGIALNGDIPQFSKFDRKNYFYPDLPKGYQISQYDLPLVVGGNLNGVRLRRIHLEEDTARLLHIANSKEQIENNKPLTISHKPSASLVDLNRAGVPLMELVTEPDIKSADQAAEFAQEMQLILRYLGISDADMERGQLRIEANISLNEVKSDKGQARWGTKVEVKNLNSFRAVKEAIEYEIERQGDLLNKGKRVVQETRGWNESRGVTVSQRLKEEAFDYRYFPEPDLPPLDLSKFDLARIKMEIPELPKEKRSRFINEYSLTAEQVEILIRDRQAAKYFEEVVSELKAESDKNLKERTQLYLNYFTTDLKGLMIDRGLSINDLKITPENFAELIDLTFNKKISSRAAKDILAKMVETGVDPSNLMEQENLAQVSDENSLKPVIEKIIKENPQPVSDYKKGKTNALQFLVGKAMAELRGRGNPEVLRRIFEKLLLK
jgi:aspartyl-tRNA(Asn)/glutamyl-tRNA(Gln) amidotransferase subunit B